MGRRRKSWPIVALVVVLAAAAAAVLYYRGTRGGASTVVEEPTRVRVSEGVQTKSVILYFASADGEKLVAEPREIVAGGGVEAEARRAIEALARGPLHGGVATLPAETTVEGVFLDSEGCMYVNFGRELRAFHWGGTSAERMTVHSLVRTLGSSFPQVKSVRFLEEGNALESLGGHLDLSRSLWVDDWR